MLNLKKIAIFQSDLNVGGIQKSLVNFLKALDKKDYQIDVYLFQKQYFYDLTGLSNHIRIIQLKPLPYWNRFIYFDILKKFVKYNINIYYDVAIDFSSYRNECALAALCTNATKHIMWIHNDIRIKIHEEPKYRILFHFFKSKLKYYDLFAAVSSGIITSFREVTKTNDKSIIPINNFINTDEIFEKSSKNIDFKVDEKKYNLASMGRLCHQKGFDILIDEVSQLIQIRNDVHLYIIGDGPDKQKLEKLVFERKVVEYITFLGNLKNPFPYLKQMDGFVLDSRYEGQGMVLWEAKALGLPIFIPKRLEKYNEGIRGCENVLEVLINAKKTNKQFDPLYKYNNAIYRKIEMIVN